MWIYVLGERNGTDVKIGSTSKPTVQERLRTVNGSQTADESYVMLAAVSSQASGEKAAKRYFSALQRRDKGGRTEYFHPDDELVEWLLWLRQQWWTSFDVDAPIDTASDVHFSEWVPTEARRETRPPIDPDRLVQDVQFRGPLAGTAWDWLPNLEATFQDYFTPTDIVARALQAMGGIDLDAASHWIAHRRLHDAGVDVRDYFHVNRSAFDHEWHGRVWLNPPYGENPEWFNRAAHMMDKGQVSQMTMLSPVWAFTTRAAGPMMSRSAAMVLLTPTPKFYNPGDPKKDGTNLPHAIVYWGGRRSEFLEAFGDIGIPFLLENGR